jgi:hypothetical protein
MADLDESNVLLPLAQCFHDSIDAIARQTEDGIYAPVEESFDQNIRSVHLAYRLNIFSH